MEDIEVYAAQTQFHPEGLKVQYIGPDGRELPDSLKEAYIKLFLEQRYRVVYIGDGDSDIYAARYAYQIFARSSLLTCCRDNNLGCKPFESFTDVIKELELL